MILYIIARNFYDCSHCYSAFQYLSSPIPIPMSPIPNPGISSLLHATRMNEPAAPAPAREDPESVSHQYLLTVTNSLPSLSSCSVLLCEERTTTALLGLEEYGRMSIELQSRYCFSCIVRKRRVQYFKVTFSRVLFDISMKKCKIFV